MVVENWGLRTFAPRWKQLISGWEHVHSAKINICLILQIYIYLEKEVITAGSELCSLYVFKCARRLIRVDVLFIQKYNCY